MRVNMLVSTAEAAAARSQSSLQVRKIMSNFPLLSLFPAYSSKAEVCGMKKLNK